MSDGPLDLAALERRDDAGGEKPKRGGSPPRRRDTRARHDQPAIERRLAESIEAVAGWVSERGDVELGAVLERDAAKMAAVLGKIAKLNPAAKKAVTVVADLLEPVRAFGPTLRVLYGRLVARRARALEGDEHDLGGEAVTPFVEATAPVGAEPLEPEVAEPWRLAE